MRIIKRFKELWTNYVILRYAIILHLGYFMISMILVLTVLREQNDFLIYFTAGKVFYTDIDDLYNQDYYLWDYRYLPLSAAFFVPFYLLGFNLGFIVFHCLNLLLNVFICVLIYKISYLVRGEDHEKDDYRVILYISLYLMGVPHMFNYILGQINLYTTFFVLMSLYIFLKHKEKKWQFLGGLMIGISIVMKPTAVLLIPFLLIINLNFKSHQKVYIKISRSFVRLTGVIFPISMNLILFMFYPKLYFGFLATNFTGSNPLTINFSFSLTKIILNICYMYNIPFNQLYILFGVMGILFGIGFLIFIFGNRNDEKLIIYGFTFGIMIMLLGYYDSWDHHFVNLTPLLVILIFCLPRESDITRKNIKRGFFFFNFFDLLFMGIWFLVWRWFPYNFGSTIFLIIVFYGLGKYVIISRNEQKKTEKNKLKTIYIE